MSHTHFQTLPEHQRRHLVMAHGRAGMSVLDGLDDVGRSLKAMGVDQNKIDRATLKVLRSMNGLRDLYDVAVGDLESLRERRRRPR